jgi:MYXO-CTERM domain-containing protein
MSVKFIPLLLLVGCGDDPLAVDKNISRWANSGSSLGAFALVREPVAFAGGAGDYPDPACPVRAKDDTTATLLGDCTDSDGRAWTGSATVTRDGATLQVDLDEFGNDALGGALRASGVVTIEELGPDEHAFEVDVTTRGGITTTVLYSGHVAGGYTGPTTWNGEGTVRMDGDFFDGGAITVKTVDQVRDDDRCAGEGLSGTTTMTSTEHEVVITYDGETNCDPDHSARWSRDGKDQGVIAGITCSTGGPAGLGLVMVVLGGLIVRRRSSLGA